MTAGYFWMLQQEGVQVSEPCEWPLEWITFRLHPCPHWEGVEKYRRDLRKGKRLPPIVLCRACFVILDGWHRVAAAWLEHEATIPACLADRHLNLGREMCRMDLINWIQDLRPYADLDCVSGSYHRKDWEHPLFQKQADELLAFGEKMPLMRYWEHVRATIFMGNLKGLKVLDVGTRESLLPHYFASKGAEVVACDLNAESMKDDGTVELRREDALSLSFADNTFDRITCTAALKHIPAFGDRLAVREMARVLKPRGLLAITVDFAERYAPYPNPATGSRTYNKTQLYTRIITPSSLTLWGGRTDFDRCDWEDWPIKGQSPTAFDAGLNVQVAFILLRKDVP